MGKITYLDVENQGANDSNQIQFAYFNDTDKDVEVVQMICNSNIRVIHPSEKRVFTFPNNSYPWVKMVEDTMYREKVQYLEISCKKFRLNLFEKGFEGNIIFSKPFVELGKSYYEHGQVVNLVQESRNEWSAKVNGQKEYFVHVYFNEYESSNGAYDTKVYKATCNCSFNGPYCIHKVAVLYAIYDKLFPNEVSIKTSPPKMYLESEDEFIQDLYWELRRAYIDLSYNRESIELSNVFRGIRTLSGEVINLAKRNEPILAARLLIVIYYELMDLRFYLMDWKDWSKFEKRWYNLYEKKPTIAMQELISNIQSEEVAKSVTQLLLDEAFQLQCDLEGKPAQYSIEEFEPLKVLYFEGLIGLSLLAESYKQIVDLLEKPQWLTTSEKEKYMNKLLSENNKYSKS